MTRKFNIIPLKPRRRKLRQDSTQSEQILWNEIRNKRLGHRFVRQYSVEGYILDFYCPKEKLSIELEGGVHNRKENKIYDNYRERYIKEFGIRLIKFSNDEILKNLNQVLNVIFLSLPKRGIKGEFWGKTDV